MIPVLPAKQIIRYAPAAVEIYQYDASPIGNRQPVLLIHGLKDEYTRMFHWQHACKYLTSSKNFREHYKIYLFRYNTAAPVELVSNAFKPALRELANTQGHPITVVALSIGGNIIRNAMTDPEVDKSISRVIALGAPFHGSPLFSKEWMQYSMLTRHKWMLTGLDRFLAYTIYFKYHKNLVADYYWDNCDQQFPVIGAYQLRFPIRTRGVLLPPTNPPPGINYNQSNEKIIAYVGYLKNPYYGSHDCFGRFSLLNSFCTFCNVTIPAHLDDQHAVLRGLNYEMASMVHNQKESEAPYVLNDGITPIASGLSLPPDVIAKTGNPDEIAKIHLQINIRKARLFQNLDHLSFTESGSSHGKGLTDQFSPTEKPRSIFGWLLSDILN